MPFAPAKPLVVCSLALLWIALAAGPGAEAQAQRTSLCVTAARANLRAGPGMKNRITWEVHKYMPLVQVGSEGDWIKVKDVDGDLHWIFKRLVDSSIACVTVSAPRANIRKGPGVKFGKWFTVERYTSFKKLDQQGGWVKLEWEGQEMWVYQTLVWDGSN